MLECLAAKLRNKINWIIHFGPTFFTKSAWNMVKHMFIYFKFDNISLIWKIIYVGEKKCCFLQLTSSIIFKIRH